MTFRAFVHGTEHGVEHTYLLLVLPESHGVFAMKRAIS